VVLAPLVTGILTSASAYHSTLVTLTSNVLHPLCRLHVLLHVVRTLTVSTARQVMFVCATLEQLEIPTKDVDLNDVHAHQPHAVLVPSAVKLEVELNAFVSLDTREILTFAVKMSTNVWEMHAASMQSVSINPGVMTAVAPKALLVTPSSNVRKKSQVLWIAPERNADVAHLPHAQLDSPAVLAFVEIFVPMCRVEGTLFALKENVAVHQDSLEMLFVNVNQPPVTMTSTVKPKRFVLLLLSEFGSVLMDVLGSNVVRMLSASRKITAHPVFALMDSEEILATSALGVNLSDNLSTSAITTSNAIKATFVSLISTEYEHVLIHAQIMYAIMPTSFAFIKTDVHSVNVWRDTFVTQSLLLVSSQSFQIVPKIRTVPYPRLADPMVLVSSAVLQFAHQSTVQHVRPSAAHPMRNVSPSTINQPASALQDSLAALSIEMDVSLLPEISAHLMLSVTKITRVFEMAKI